VAITAASAVALARLHAAGGPVLVHSRYPSGVNLDVAGTLVYAGPHAAGGACSLQVSGQDVAVLAGSSVWTWTAGGLVSAEGSDAVRLADDASVYAPVETRLATLDPTADLRLRLNRSAAGGTSWFDEGPGRYVALPRLRKAVTALVAPGTDVVDRVRAVVGLGSGLTPSCDDALVGALCLLQARSHQAGVSAADLLAGSPTTDVSASSLRLALAGVFSLPLARVVGLLGARGSDQDSDLQLAVHDLVSIGATSGSDSLVGLELACQALAAGDQPPVIHLSPTPA